MIALGGTGYLFVNGSYVSDLDLSRLNGPGSIGLLGAWFIRDELAGRSTQYSEFTIRPLRKAYGPRDGSIEHDPEDSLIDAHESDAGIADGIIDVAFSNPDGDWSYGILLRNSAYNTFHAIIVSKYGYQRNWHHIQSSGTVEDRRQLAVDSSVHIDAGKDDGNHMRIIAMGPEGTLFINGRYVATLNLSGLTDAGHVSTVGAYWGAIAGKATDFEGFTIWSADGKR